MKSTKDLCRPGGQNRVKSNKELPLPDRDINPCQKLKSMLQALFAFVSCYRQSPSLLWITKDHDCSVRRKTLVSDFKRIWSILTYFYIYTLGILLAQNLMRTTVVSTNSNPWRSHLTNSRGQSLHSAAPSRLGFQRRRSRWNFTTNIRVKSEIIR